MDVTELVGWLGGVMIVARLVPQTVRLLRTGSTAGVSGVGALCWLGNDVGWVVYGLREGLAPLWLPSALLLVLDLLVATMLIGRLRWRELAPGFAWIAAVTIAAVVGQGALGLALIAGSATGTLPHGWRALRSDDLSGVAPMTWALAVVDGMLWGLYGTARADAAVTWYAALTLLTGVVVLWRIRACRPSPPGPSLHLA